MELIKQMKTTELNESIQHISKQSQLFIQNIKQNNSTLSNIRKENQAHVQQKKNIYSHSQSNQNKDSKQT